MGFFRKMFSTSDTPEMEPPRSGTTTQNTAEIEADLRATPVSRDRMDLLWLPPGNLEGLKALSQDRHYTSIATVNMAGGPGELTCRVFSKAYRGEISLDDINWAIETDAIAAKADEAGHAESYSDAIRYYREALRLAPGCDLYLMSMGCLYANINQFGVGLRYLQRAAEINPDNPRIARNLKGLKDHIADHQRG